MDTKDKVCECSSTPSAPEDPERDWDHWEAGKTCNPENMHCLFQAVPARTGVMRATYRTIGGLLQRLREIEAELKQMGAVREYNSRPTPAKNCVDRSFFAELVPKSKRARAAGIMLDHHAFAPLNMVGMQKLQSRIDALYNEDCDVLIHHLCEFQLDGIEFEFQH